MIPRAEGWVDFSAVKRGVSLEAVLRHYQIPGLRRHRDQLQGRCPFHRGHREDSFRAHLTKNVFHCFACQARGNVLDFVAAMEHCSIREAALRLQQWFGISAAGVRLYPAVADRQNQKLVRKEEGSNLPLRFALTGVETNHPYLAHRGIDPATAAEFGVGFYPGPGLMSGCIVIPIRNPRGQLVAYAGRALDGRSPKYKVPAGFRKTLELFNLQRAVATGSNTVIVVEGYFDCMRVHQAGFPWVVALMGSFSFGAAGRPARSLSRDCVDAGWGHGRSDSRRSDRSSALGLALAAGGACTEREPTGSVIILRHPAVAGSSWLPKRGCHGKTKP